MPKVSLLYRQLTGGLPVVYETADERKKRLKSMTIYECIAALNYRWISLQPSIRTLLEKRLTRDLETTRSRNAELAKEISTALAKSERARNAS